MKKTKFVGVYLMHRILKKDMQHKDQKYKKTKNKTQF